MLKTMAWSLVSGGFLAAGFAYAYSRRAQSRRLAASGHFPQLEARREIAPEVYQELTPDEGDEFEIEFVDLDAMTEEEEAYDATSPDDLGALWLSRATQTSGVRASPRIAGIAAEPFEDEDELDPAGRPTEPPGASLDARRHRSSGRG